MYRMASAVILGITFAAVAVHFILAGPGELAEKRKLSLCDMFIRLVYLAGLASFAVLAVSGFLPVLLSGGGLKGYLLVAHMSAAGAGIVCVTILVPACAKKNMFKQTDTTREILSKLCFWSIAVLALCVILSAVLNMYPIFASAQQHMMVDIHRSCTLLFTVTGIIHTYITVTDHIEI